MVKIWSHNIQRERYRCMLYWERTVSQCQNNWEPRAHISFVGAGLHFLMENILVLTLTPLERPSDPQQLKWEEKQRNDSFTYFTVTLFGWCHESSSIRKITSFCIKNQKPERDFLMLRCHQTLRPENKLVNIFLSQHLIFVQKYFSSASAIR